MLDRLLNRTCNIFRYVQTSNDSGDLSNTLTQIATAIKMRITVNKKMANDPIGDAGLNIPSSHLIFCKPIIITITIPAPATQIVYLLPGDVIVDTSTPPTQNDVKYTVNYFDAMPGGEPNSHWQIYATMVEA